MKGSGSSQGTFLAFLCPEFIPEWLKGDVFSMINVHSTELQGEMRGKIGFNHTAVFYRKELSICQFMTDLFILLKWNVVQLLPVRVKTAHSCKVCMVVYWEWQYLCF